MKKLKIWFQKANKEKLFLYVTVLVLIAIIALRCNKKCDTSEIEMQKDELAIAFDSLKAVNHTLVNRPADIETIVETRTVFKDHKTFIKNWDDLQNHKSMLQAQMEENDRVWAMLDKTNEEFDLLVENQGAFTFESLSLVTEPPIISTRTDERNEDFEIKGSIVSKDSLISWERSVTVFPNTLTITRKPSQDEIQAAAKELEKLNYIGITAGAVTIDNFGTWYYVPALVVGRKSLMFEIGPVLDKGFKFDKKNWEAKIGLVKRF